MLLLHVSKLGSFWLMTTLPNHSKANEYARNHGLRQFCIYQGRWSAACRDLERDVIPMCKAEGMAIAPWGSLGGGRFKSDEARGSNDGRQLEATEDDIKISKTLQMIANRKDTVITSIALAYVMHKSPYVFPVIGGRKVEHLRANIEALTIELTEEDVAEIDGALPFDLGFPHNFLWGRQVPKSPQDIWLLSTAGNFDYVENPRVGATPSLLFEQGQSIFADSHPAYQCPGKWREEPFNKVFQLALVAIPGGEA